MISESQARLALPDRGWLRDYVRYAESITDCNLAFHIIAGLALLSQTVPITFVIPNGRLRANIYGLIVGESSSSHKTAAVKIAMRILQIAKPEAIMSMPGSNEWLVDSLIERPQQVLLVGEGGPFMSQMVRGYLSVLKDRLAEIYDCTRLARGTVTKGGGKRKKDEIDYQDNPRLSLLVAISDAFLEDYTNETDWTGGYLARFFTIYANRTRDEDLAGKPRENEEKELAERLAQMATFFAGDAYAPKMMGECLGYDDAAKQRWSEWRQGQKVITANGISRTARASVFRAEDMVHKISGLLAWDYGAARTGDPWHITRDILEPALAITQLHIDSVLAVGDTLSSDRDMRTMRKVLQAIGTSPTSLSQIFRTAQVTSRIGEEMIKTLMAHKRIELAEAGDGERRFRRIDDDGEDRVPLTSAIDPFKADLFG